MLRASKQKDFKKEGSMKIKTFVRRISTISTSVVIALAAIAPVAFQARTSAAQLTNREASVTTARPGQAFSITFQYRLPSSTPIQAMQFQFCDSPIGTVCNGTNNPTVSGATYTSINANWTNATAFGALAVTTAAGGGSATNNQIQVTRTQAATETQVGSNDRSVTFGGLTHNATANRTFYVRMRLYSDVAATTLVHDGAVAQSTSQTLTINARVQEVLAFCVGATTIDDATTTTGAACANITGTDVDLGIIDAGAVNITPVSVAAGGDNENAVAMVRTNAVNGVVIDYKTIQNTSSGKLKVAGATCSGSDPTDQCFNSSGTTQNSMVAGTEEFGMTIAGINCGSTTSYTCTFSTGTYNLVRDAEYDGAGTNTYTAGAGNNYAWDDTGTADRIASSAGSAVKVVDDEAMILKFAATSAITTPTGAYTVQADFIATPTF